MSEKLSIAEPRLKQLDAFNWDLRRYATVCRAEILRELEMPDSQFASLGR
jgi:hypothetical protein